MHATSPVGANHPSEGERSQDEDDDMEYLSRRRFLKISATTFAGVAASTQWQPLARLASAADAPAKGIATIPTFCEMCFWRCSGIAYVRDGKLWKFEGNPKDPQSRGRLCPRGTGAVGAHYDPDRLQKPLIRRGERGREEWTAVTWDEALRLHRRPDAEDQGAAWAGSRRRHHTRHRPALFPACAEELGRDQFRRTVVRAMPRPPRRRLCADVRRRPGLTRAHRHREHRLPGPDRVAPRREHAQLAGAGIRQGGRTAHSDHRRRSALLGSGQQGQALAADQAGHRSRAAARVDERAGDRGPLRPGVRREIRPRLRQVRRRDQGVHPRMGGDGNRHRREPDPRYRARIREPSASDDRAPRPARELERRRHAKEPRHRAAVRAARQLGPQGRALPGGRHEDRALSAASVSEVGQAEGGWLGRRALPFRRRRDHDQHPRRDAYQQAVSDQGLVRLLVEHPLRAAEHERDAEGDRQSRPVGRRRHDRKRDRRLRRRRAAGVHVPRAPRRASGRLRPHRMDVAAPAGRRRAARAETGLVDRAKSSRKSSA